jgi:hypothetical protein
MEVEISALDIRFSRMGWSRKQCRKLSVLEAADRLRHRIKCSGGAADR